MPLTLRELLWVQEGSEIERHDRWRQAAQVCAVLANCNRDPRKGRAYTTDDFDPMSRGKSSVVDASTPEGKARMIKMLGGKR